ncbi:hypothetical protein CFP56_035977 [Quercus suber]|uniref:Uncharacterized protein n=1 Tax=Quercus suber TaxID=58331 RepID=A0AAW0J8I6_QUESU
MNTNQLIRQKKGECLAQLAGQASMNAQMFSVGDNYKLHGKKLVELVKMLARDSLLVKTSQICLEPSSFRSLSLQWTNTMNWLNHHPKKNPLPYPSHSCPFLLLYAATTNFLHHQPSDHHNKSPSPQAIAATNHWPPAATQPASYPAIAATYCQLPPCLVENIGNLRGVGLQLAAAGFGGNAGKPLPDFSRKTGTDCLSGEKAIKEAVGIGANADRQDHNFLHVLV